MMFEAPEKTDWIEFNEALSRKTMEQFTTAAKRNAAGKITDRELYLIIAALWDTVAGLVDAEVLRILEAAHADLRRQFREKKEQKANLEKAWA
jgi:hypothetical protein